MPFQLSSDSGIWRSSALNDKVVTGVRRLAHKDQSSAVVQFASRICAGKKFVWGADEEGSFAPVMASITEQVAASGLGGRVQTTAWVTLQEFTERRWSGEEVPQVFALRNTSFSLGHLGTGKIDVIPGSRFANFHLNVSPFGLDTQSFPHAWRPLKFRVLQCANPLWVPFALAVLVRGPSDLPVQRNSEGRMSFSSWYGLRKIDAETCSNGRKRAKTESVFRSGCRQLVSDSRSLPRQISLFKKEGRHQPLKVAHIKRRRETTHQDPIVFPVRSDADNTSVKRGCSLLCFDTVIDLVFHSSL